MISPTLFIGLGSTGLAIIEHLQELLLEHYGRPSLPIFHYIAIETREGVEVKRSEWGANDIELLRLTISNTNFVKRELLAGNRKYLEEWLNPKLLDIPGGEFKAGADNTRMAGRLILMENWTQISTTIKNAKNKINSDINITETRKFLVNHYKRNGHNIDTDIPLIDSMPNVYIVGTLCGGTCSGMFLDIAYYTKQITGLYAKNLINPKVAKIIGLFTVFDTTALHNTEQEGNKRNAANCWAAMLEYDYYCHNQTNYKFMFPSGDEVDTNESPIDAMYLVSCTATDPNNKVISNFHTKDGKADLVSVNHMAATVLFSETVGDMLEHKSAIRTNFRTLPRTTTRNHAEHSACFYSCGMATIWYPKYRIALASSHRYAELICREWFGKLSAEQIAELRKSVAREWNDMLTQYSAKLTAALETQIGSQFADPDADCKRSPDEYRDLMKLRLQNLLQGGEYHQYVSNPKKLEEFSLGLLDAINKRFEQLIDSEKNLSLAREWLKALDHAIAECINHLPRSYPDSRIGVEDIKSDIFMRLVFRRDAYELQRKQEIHCEKKQYMLVKTRHIRNYFMREQLERLRESLGVGQSLPKEMTQAGILTLQQRLDAAILVLDQCIENFSKRYSELREKANNTSDVMLVFQGDNKELKTAIETTVSQLEYSAQDEKDRIYRKITKDDDQRMSAFLGMLKRGEPVDYVSEHILAALIPEIILKIGEFDISDYVLKHWHASDLANFAKHGLPHIELTSSSTPLASAEIGHSVSFVAGKNQVDLQSLLNKLAKTECSGIYEEPAASRELAHMLLFYREEGLMYMDDNLATAHIFEKCYNDAEDAFPFGLHTHKNGRIAFDSKVFRRRHKTENELMPIALKILARKDKAREQWEDSEVFGLENGSLVMRIKLPGKPNFILTANKIGIDDCAKKPEIFEYFQDAVMNHFNKLTNDSLIDRIDSYMDSVEHYLRQRNVDEEVVQRGVKKESELINNIPAIKERLR